MKKILFVITQAEMGGAQRAVFELAAGLKDRYEIVVAAGEPAGSDELVSRCESAGIRIVRLGHLHRAIRPRQDIRAVFELRAMIRNERPDIVHAHSSKAGIISSLACCTPHHARCTLIYTAHGWVFQEPLSPLRRLLYLWMEKIAARERKATIVLSESEKKIALANHLGSNASLVVIPNGVSCPPKMFDRDRARAEISRLIPIDSSTRLLGAVANLYPAKGLDTLVAAAGIVYDLYPDVHFIIAGEGPERKKIEREIRSRNLDEIVRLIGKISDPGQFLPAFDIFVLSSRKEGLPFALLDAAAAGLPIVATRVGGIPEVLRDETDALLVAPDDPSGLAKAILQLLDDPRLSARLAVSAKDRICSSFTLDRMLRETAALYDRLLS